MRFETKPGKSFACAGVLPSSSGERDDRRGRLVRGLHGADHLDELQDGHRVEEVHADDLVGPGRDCGERRDRYRRGVGGEDRLSWEDGVSAPEDLRLHVGVLDDGLDQEIGGYEVVDGDHAREHVVGIGAALLGELAQALPHRAERAIDRARRLVVERDTSAGGRDHLGDAAAHLTRADDQDVLEAHARSLGLRLRRAGQIWSRALAQPDQCPQQHEREDHDPDEHLDKGASRLPALGHERPRRDHAAG